MSRTAPRRPPPSRRFHAWVERMAAERPHHLTFYVFLLACAVVIPVSLPFWIYDTADFFQEVMAEAHGVLLDILVIGWLLFWMRKQGERRLMTQRYREEIEDYLGWRTPEATLRIAGNIRRLNRQGVNLPLTLTEAYLHGANLADAKLEEADLWGADLTQAKLPGARLAEANLAGAILRGADLTGASLTGADLRGADCTEADLERAYLENADLRGVNFTACDLQFAAMPGANLEHARLLGANLRGAHLERTRLARTHFEGATLHGASLDGADLRGADFTRADLSRADLTGAILPEGEALITLFDDVRSLVGAKLPREAEAVLTEACPHLFEEPQEVP
jgi:BTB/POZ domain-containing protein KCTD9